MREVVRAIRRFEAETRRSQRILVHTDAAQVTASMPAYIARGDMYFDLCPALPGSR